MTGTRTELPWEIIGVEVMTAIEWEMPDAKFVNAKWLARQILENPERYPLLGGLPAKTCIGRCTHVMRHVFNWETRSNGNGRGTLFVKGD